MKLILKKITILSLILLGFGVLFAQTVNDTYQDEEITEKPFTEEKWEEHSKDKSFDSGESANELYKGKEITERSFDKDKWEKLAKDKGFEKFEEEEEYKPKESNAPIFNGISKTAKIVLFCLAILLLVFIIIRIFVGNVALTNKKVNSTRPIVLEEVEKNLHESDLDRFLREALANKNYHVAIRLYYLMIIKELSSKNLIKWKLDKTNRDYLSEMRNHNSFPDFRNITRTFDMVWYGEFALEQEDFSAISPLFEQYINKIKS